MSDEYGNQLFLSFIVNFFVETTAILWIYPILAFTFSLRYRTETGQILYDTVREPLRVSLGNSKYPLHRILMVNTGYALLILVFFFAVALLNGFVLAVLGIILVNLGLIDDVLGIQNIALVTALLVFLGHITGQSSSFSGEDVQKSNDTDV